MPEKFPNDVGDTLVGGAVDAALEDAASIGGNLANAGKSTHKFMTGSRAVIKLNGKLAGFAHSVTFRVNTSQVDVLTIDDWTPYEIAPSRVSVEGTLGMFYVPGKGASSELLQSNVLSFLHHRYITIEIRDRKTDELIFTTNKAVITSRYQELKAGELSNVVLNFKALGWADEMVPKFADGHSGGDAGSKSLVENLVGDVVKDVTSFFS